MSKKKSPAKVKKKPKYNLKTKITSALRKVWRYYPETNKARKRAETGKTYDKISKRGNKYKHPYYKCEKCSEVVDKIQIDHKKPVVDYNGFQNWALYIDRLFVNAEELQCICKSCHSVVGALQRELRKKYKKILTN